MALDRSGIGLGLLLPLAVASGMGLAGCTSDRLDGNTVGVQDAQYEVMPFEQYRDRALRKIDGKQLYQVEFDLFFSSEEDLYTYYVQRVEEELDKSTAIVDLSTNERATWVRKDTALNIRYCVSNGFGTDQSAVEADVAEAMQAWEGVTNLHYVYDPSENGNCTGASATIDVAVIPGASGGGACGTPPYLPPATLPMWCPYPLGTLAIDYAGWPWTSMSGYPNIDLVGVFRHELGHINGLRHEHVRATTPGCGETPVICFGTACLGSDYLTDYDFYSVMHYPGDHRAGWDRSAGPVRHAIGLVHTDNRSTMRGVAESGSDSAEAG